MEWGTSDLHASTCEGRVLLEDVRRCRSCQQKNINDSTLWHPAHISPTPDLLFGSCWAHLGQCVLEKDVTKIWEISPQSPSSKWIYLHLVASTDIRQMHSKALGHRKMLLQRKGSDCSVVVWRAGPFHCSPQLLAPCWSPPVFLRHSARKWLQSCPVCGPGDKARNRKCPFCHVFDIHRHLGYKDGMHLRPWNTKEAYHPIHKWVVNE